MNRSYDCCCWRYDTNGVGLEMIYRFSNISTASKRNYLEVLWTLYHDLFKIFTPSDS